MWVGVRARAGGEGQLVWGWGWRPGDRLQPGFGLVSLYARPPQESFAAPSSAGSPHPHTPLTLPPCLQGPRHHDTSVGGWRA